MADGKKPPKKCMTIIPREWPQFTGPAYRDGMSVDEATTLWRAFLRVHRKVGVTPKVFRRMID